MALITRRKLFAGTLAAFAMPGAVAAYAVVVEPGFRLVVREYRLSLPGWAARPPMTLCLLADPHCCEPWMPLERLRRIVGFANTLGADAHLFLGDLPGHHRFVLGAVSMAEAAAVLGELRAPLGRFAVLGNHDWWDDAEVQRAGTGRPAIEGHLSRAGFAVLSNAARLLPHGAGVWLCGTDSMGALRARRRGADDLGAVLACLDSEAPAILMAHEPDMFPRVPPRIALTLSGHTHGGQVRLLGHAPLVPSRYGQRYAYGLAEEEGRRLIVSGGLGCSIMPVRLGVPPELNLVHLI